MTRNANASDALYAVIGGYRWDRYNLGVASTSPATNNPDVNPMIAALHGKFYQWGRQAAVADAVTSGDGSIASWNTVAATDGAWNSGTTAKPVRTANDPCATGTRVPSLMEFSKLLGNTNQTSTGTWGPTTGTATTTDYSVAKVLTSKKSKDIVLTFPAAGDLILRVFSWIVQVLESIGQVKRLLELITHVISAFTVVDPIILLMLGIRVLVCVVFRIKVYSRLKFQTHFTGCIQ